jgi:hypothetical protein
MNYTCLKHKLVRCFCTLLVIHFSFPGYCQDTTWKIVSITPDLSISFPEPVFTQDTAQMKILNSQVNGYFFQIKYIKPKFEVRNGDELIQAYDGFLKGYLTTKEISPFTSNVSDTSFNGTRGEWIHSTYSKDTSFEEIFSYLVLVNNHFYMVSLVGNHPIKTGIDPMLLRYFSSINFPNKPIKEYSGNFPLQSKSYRTGQHIGQGLNTLLPYFLIVMIAVPAIFFVYVKFIRKKKLGGM